MSKIRFRKRVQIDGDQNLYARNPLNPAEFIIVGNLNGTTEVTTSVTLDKTIRYRKTIRIDENDDLYIRVGDTFVDIGNANGASTESWLKFGEQVVSAIKASSATLSSSYTFNKIPITGAKLQWGTSKTDSSWTEVVIEPSTSPLTYDLTGLSSNKTYYFRTVITTKENSEAEPEVFTSEWTEFKTGLNNIVFGTQGATDVSATSATLNSAYTHNGANITGVKLQYTGSIDPVGTINDVTGIETDGTISGAVSDLTLGKTYYFRGVVNCEGNDIAGKWVEFTTAAE